MRKYSVFEGPPAATVMRKYSIMKGPPTETVVCKYSVFEVGSNKLQCVKYSKGPHKKLQRPSTLLYSGTRHSENFHLIHTTQHSQVVRFGCKIIKYFPANTHNRLV